MRASTIREFRPRLRQKISLFMVAIPAVKYPRRWKWAPKKFKWGNMRARARHLLKQALLQVPEFQRIHQRIRALSADLEATGEERNQLKAQIDRLTAHTKQMQSQTDQLIHTVAEQTALLGDEQPFAPNGHFYSPIHSRKDLAEDLFRIYPVHPSPPRDIDLNEEGQLELLRKFKPYLNALPFQAKNGALRYGYANDMYGLGDASALIAMLRHLRPKRFIEVGSGHSSAVALDTNELWLEKSVQFTFIEPYPERLMAILKPDDFAGTTIYQKRVQDVDPSVFAALEADDILFIDSTHVSKIGSDVNHLFFEILPILPSNVYIHIHDVFYPFEYPRHWTLQQGRAWNELYLLRALLQNSKSYQIVHFSNFLYQKHSKALLENAPQIFEYPGGNVWLRKN